MVGNQQKKRPRNPGAPMFVLLKFCCYISLPAEIAGGSEGVRSITT